jgi:HlyD family secretion protein
MLLADLRHRSRTICLEMWRHRWGVLAATAIGVAVAVGGTRLYLGPAVPVDAVVRRELIQTVVASGHVEAPYRAEIGAQITGVVYDVPVGEGQFVHAGDALILLDDRDARAAVDQALSAVQSAEARIRQIDEVARPAAQETLKQNQATLLNARQSFERTEALNRNGYATRAQYDEARRNLDIAMAQVRAAQLQFASNQPGGSDFTMAQHALTQAQAALRSANTRLAYTIITAPRDGTLITRNVERGDVVQPGKVLMTLSPAGDTDLVVQIDEKNLGLIALGQKALASADAYPNRSFPATLSYINPAVDLQRASVEVKLRVAPENVPSYLRQDMTVSVDIEIARKPDALVLPIQDVRDLAGASPWVLKVAKDRARKQPVTVGLRAITHVEIAAGLAPGDMVVPAGVALREGERVRPVPRE